MKPNAIASCQSKKFYSTQGEAIKTVEYLWYKKGVEVDTYKCNLCEGWHLTSKTD